MKFSVIVVSLNPGEKLKETIDSILGQTYKDYEIVVKDGGSKDGSVLLLPEDERIRLYVEKDKSIYDAMNQAVQKANGEYILFMNCGDCFYDESVLEKAADRIEQEKGDEALVVYGDTYGAKNDVLITAPGKIDGFACYRNIPCHQSCFYEARLCKEKPYREEYRIRADYDHFLWCYYEAKAKMVYLGSTVAAYEGGGYSESKENRKRDKEEHRLITEAYMDAKDLAKYRRTMLLTLAPIRSFLAENKLTSWFYHWIKDCVYRHKLRMVLGLLFLVAELYLFLGTGVMREGITNNHIGEGSWGETATPESASFCQQFEPQYRNLHMISFLMFKDNVTVQDGTVIVTITNRDNEVEFREERTLAQVADGRFTDVDVNLRLSARNTYYLTIECTPSSAGEYPAVGVCGTEYELPENGVLTRENEMPGVQLVSRYEYTDALTLPRLVKVLFVCLLTVLGIMFGVPRNKYVRKTVAIGLLLVGPYVLGQRLEMLVCSPYHYLPFAMKWNVGIMYGLEILVLLCTHSARVAIVVTNVALTFLYSVNYFVVMYRGTPLRMNDFTAAGTAAKVMGEYSFVPNDDLAVIWGLLVVFIVFGVQTGSVRTGKKLRWQTVLSYIISITIALIAGGYGYYQLTYTDFLENVGFEDEKFRGFHQDLIYSYDGFLVGTCIEVKNSRIRPLEGYSKANVEAILEAVCYEQEPAEDLPHVILVMNESFADLRVLDNLEISRENMVFFNSLEKNVVRGYANASVLGGGTSNTEFEVLTGCNTAFFPVNYYPYQQAIKKPVNSVISQMEKYGYTTYSMHPEVATNWNRNNVYRYLGFDQSFWLEDFEIEEYVHREASDAETYKKIIELYENRQDGERMFIFDVTMQNHGGYSKDAGPDTVVATNLQEPEVDEYLSLIKISDEAFKDLVGYFEKQEEKVIICMFGDHQPWVSDLILETDVTDSNLSMELLMKKYKTPFVIWANYDIEEVTDCNISMNYLGGLLLRTAGVPLSPYFEFLEDLSLEYPIITANGYVDSQGNYYNWNDDGNEFSEYRMLQYNYLFDDTIEWGY